MVTPNLVLMKHLRLLTTLGLAGLTLAVSAMAQQPAEIQRLKIVQTVEPEFPLRLLNSHPQGGQARVLISVSAQGELEDYLVVGYTHRGFADELVSAIRRWKFEPTRVNNEPIASSTEIVTSFEPKGVITDLLPTEAVLQATVTPFSSPDAYRPRRPGELDRIPNLVRVVHPAYSKELYDRGVVGEVTLEYFIDEQGNARMPSAYGDGNPTLAALARQAVREWKFDPPTAKGEPAIVQVRQKFIFNEASLKLAPKS